MKKRGSLVGKALIVMLASFIILVSFKSVGEAFGTQEIFYKQAVAKDIALTIDLLYSMPGDVEYIYPNKVSGYDVEIKNNRVSVYGHNSNKLDPTIGIYEFAGISSDSLDFVVRNQQFVRLIKNGEKLGAVGITDGESS